MISQRNKWLDGAQWDQVVEQNRKLCEFGKVTHELQPQNCDLARKMWETAGARSLHLPEALDLLRQCIAKAPFRYNNVNTFSAIAAMLIEDAIKQLSPVEARILCRTVCQYVEGAVGKAELRQTLSHFESRFSAEPLVKPTLSASAPVRAEPQTT